MAGIYHYGFFITITAEQFGIDLAEAGAVHTFNMYISNASAGKLFHFLGAALYPTFVKQLALSAIADGLYSFFKTFFSGRIVYGKYYFASDFAFK